MNKELYVSSTPHETKVALVEDDQLAEVFFERENEYTLAGSIYKGRVTRVLPGMQSAFVDIGLERDAFLYVSDFLELPSDEEDDEEFGQIPTPRTTVDIGKTPPVQEAYSLDGPAALGGLESEEESETVVEDFAAPIEGDSAVGELETSSGEDRDAAGGVRRWRGRQRRRGGRRGRPDNGEDRPEPKTETVREPEPTAAPRSEARLAAAAGRQRSDFSPAAGYTPIILPGESISKYRNRAPQPAPEQQQGTAAEERGDVEQGQVSAEPYEVHHEAHGELAPPAEMAAEIAHEETVEAEAAHRDEERQELESPDDAHWEPSPARLEPQAPETPEATTAGILARWPQNQEEDVVEDESEAEIHAGSFPTAGAHLEHPTQP